jgi:phosphatidylglycerophosphate synthase
MEKEGKACCGMEKNVGKKDATIRMIAATFIVLLFLFGAVTGWVALVLAIVAVGLFYSALSRSCLLYKYLGKNTLETTGQ